MAEATIDQTRNAGFTTGLLSRLRSEFSRWVAYRKTLRELQSLSDRQLDDLGLSRGMLHQVALDAAGDTRG